MSPPIPDEQAGPVPPDPNEPCNALIEKVIRVANRRLRRMIEQDERKTKMNDDYALMDCLDAEAEKYRAEQKADPFCMGAPPQNGCVIFSYPLLYFTLPEGSEGPKTFREFVRMFIKLQDERAGK
jgi:hypothetical protein